MFAPDTEVEPDHPDNAAANQGPLDEEGAPPEGAPPLLPATALPPGAVRGRRVEGSRQHVGSEGEGMDWDAEEVAARGGRLQLEAIDFQRGVGAFVCLLGCLVSKTLSSMCDHFLLYTHSLLVSTHFPAVFITCTTGPEPAAAHGFAVPCAPPAAARARRRPRHRPATGCAA